MCAVSDEDVGGHAGFQQLLCCLLVWVSPIVRSCRGRAVRRALRNVVQAYSGLEA
jgi:hypothetical protein